jgi:hypothetical protein
MSATSGAKRRSQPSSRSRAESRPKGRGYRAKSSFGPNWVGLTNRLVTTVPLVRARFLARRTSARCPSCKAPMVGTKTTGRGSLETSFCILRGSRTIRINGTAHRCGRLLKKDPDRPFGKRRRIGETANGRNGDASIQNNPGICAQVKSEPLGRPFRALLPFDVYPEAPWAILFCHFMVDARCAFVPPVRRFAHSPLRRHQARRRFLAG